LQDISPLNALVCLENQGISIVDVSKTVWCSIDKLSLEGKISNQVAEILIQSSTPITSVDKLRTDGIA